MPDFILKFDAVQKLAHRDDVDPFVVLGRSGRALLSWRASHFAAGTSFVVYSATARSLLTMARGR